jgi:polar amino acid transport system permease protein
LSIVDTFFNARVFLDTWPLLISGLSNTLLLGVVSNLFGLALGLGLALARLYGSWPLRYLTIAYVDVFRAIPLLVLLVVVYYALPFLGIRLSSFAAATTAISMVAGAYSAEIFRAGIEAVPKGQFEAARALGLSPIVTMRKVILPQAIRIVVPPITSNAVSVLKDTALASVVAMPDLLKQANQAQALAANPTPLIVAAGIYLIILLPMVRVVGAIEKRWKRDR